MWCGHMHVQGLHLNVARIFVEIKTTPIAEGEEFEGTILEQAFSDFLNLWV